MTDDVEREKLKKFFSDFRAEESDSPRIVANLALVFGVFDGFHDGHKFFLAEALKRTDELLVVVAPDRAVETLKGKKPRIPFVERARAVSEYDNRIRVLEGDDEQGSWKVLKNAQPDVVFLGYDQTAIADELKKMKIRFDFIESHDPHIHKSSLLS
ncbi:adenylyltransferase/cytidyltransferase family protein [Patescibacteria group bacterium]|nr:adenylyltransferase/cytidyltransferase family protein [Patescibacteria group bacterium]